MEATQRPTPCSARLSANGTKIILGGGPGAWSEFCQSLPNARWQQFEGCWTCDFTPAAAWRIAYHGLANRAGLSNQVVEAAGRFGRQLVAAQTAMMAENLPEPASKTQAWAHQLRAFHFADAICGGTL